jgi:chromosomal replication initiator protein
MWLKETTVAEVEEDAVVINVPNRFAREYVSSRLGSVLRSSLAQVCGEEKALKFQVGPAAEDGENANGERSNVSASAESTYHSTDPSPIPLQALFRKDMTFGSFVVGPCNRLAHAAAAAFAQGETSFSPFLVYGGIGLGKTHLLQALCSTLAAQNGRKVDYMTCEAFVAEFCSAVSGSRRDTFQKRILSLDVLAIDDVHRLAQKEGTQKEFLFLFNELHLRDKVILLASRDHPNTIEGLDEGLRCRFISGIAIPLEKPTYPTRLGILKRRIGRDAKDFPEESIELAARSLNGNVTELVGVANRLVAEARFTGTEMTARRTGEVLAEFVAHPLEIVGLADIEKAVCDLFGVSTEQVKSRKQSRAIIQARQVAMYLARELLGLSYSEIGDFFGGKNHTTVLCAEKRVRKLLEENPETQALVTRLQERLGPRR